jgi:hypothetical protein
MGCLGAHFSFPADQGGELWDGDEASFDYPWYWFELMRAFFRKTADEGRHMVFTADQ